MWQEIFHDRWKESARKNSHCRQTIRVFVLRKGVCPKSKHAGNGLFSYFLLWFDLNNIRCLSLNVKSKSASLLTYRILCTRYRNTVNRAVMHHVTYNIDNFNLMNKFTITFNCYIRCPYLYACKTQNILPRLRISIYLLLFFLIGTRKNSYRRETIQL